MSKISYIVASVAAVIGLTTSKSQAQGYVMQPGSGCVCCGSNVGSQPMMQPYSQPVTQAYAPPAGQSYQRFSYEPSASPQQAITAAPMPVYPAAQMQSYRRYSYQPAVRSDSRLSVDKPPYHYPKTDPRRYRIR